MEPNNMEKQKSNIEEGAWFKVWHPRGVQVSHNISGDAKSLLALVSEYLDAGWLVNAPGVNPGEDKLEICSIVRRTKKNNDGSFSPIIDMYEPGNDWKSFSHYLDTQEEVLDFEYASGLRLQNIQTYEGQAAPKKGVSPDADRKFVDAPKTFIIIVKPNPRWRQADADAAKAANQAYKIPMKAFVRFEKQRPKEDGNGHQQPANGSQAKPAQTPEQNASPPAKSTMGPAQAEIDAAVTKWLDWITSLEKIDKGEVLDAASISARAFSECVKIDLPKTPQKAKLIVWNRIMAYAEEKRKWYFEKDTKEFIDPNLVPF